MYNTPIKTNYQRSYQQNKKAKTNKYLSSKVSINSEDNQHFGFYGSKGKKNYRKKRLAAIKSKKKGKQQHKKRKKQKKQKQKKQKQYININAEDFPTLGGEQKQQKQQPVQKSQMIQQGQQGRKKKKPKQSSQILTRLEKELMKRNLNKEPRQWNYEQTNVNPKDHPKFI